MIDFERAVALLKEAAKNESFGGRHANSKTERVRKLRAGIAALRTKNATWLQVAERVSEVLEESISMDTVRKAMAQPTDVAPKPSASRTEASPPPVASDAPVETAVAGTVRRFNRA